MNEPVLAQIESESRAVVTELLRSAPVRAGQLLVIGCSTSEVKGSRIGKDGNSEIAEAIFRGIAPIAEEKGIRLAFQCCEHLNRALVIERETAEQYRLDEVSVVPYPHAGGSMAAYAYRHMREAVVVEAIQAHFGLDIGETLIGMHLKAVAVPVRLQNRQIGRARVNAAYTRAKLIGGVRAKYELEQEDGADTNSCKGM